MGISVNAGEDVLPYGWFDDWLDGRLMMLKNLDDVEN